MSRMDFWCQKCNELPLRYLLMLLIQWLVLPSLAALKSLMRSTDVSAEELGEIITDSFFLKIRHAELYAPTPPDDEGSLDNICTLAELDDALRLYNAKSAAGQDGIPYSGVKNPPHNGKEALLDYYNDIWVTADVQVT